MAALHLTPKVLSTSASSSSPYPVFAQSKMMALIQKVSSAIWGFFARLLPQMWHALVRSKNFLFTFAAQKPQLLAGFALGVATIISFSVVKKVVSKEKRFAWSNPKAFND